MFQHRQDGYVDFYRDCTQYKNGRGEIMGEVWLGNDYLHLLTRDDQELRVSAGQISRHLQGLGSILKRLRRNHG